ncbi:MAG: sulfite exporter TauE/SafE family protein [Candidatus Electrothrix communis]|nr:sulfite exporter TauE/SafE family protein [Desulfobulbus sp. US4]WLE98716.1 MAG: sulfite exporter TauE/SafE family protein [Candidatus Electrothrix communis]
MELQLLIGCLGLFVGFFSGLLGIGGGILMAPLLLYIPGWFDLQPLPMRDIAGLTIVQGLVACLSGALTHKKFHFVSNRLTAWMGITIFLTALIGGAAARYVTNTLLLVVFALMALLAALLILIPPRQDSESPDITKFSFSRSKAMLIAGAVGLTGGLVGQGGSFLLIPLMTSFMQVPTRIAIGSNLAIVLLSSLAAFLGKALTGQIVWPLALPIILTVIPAAHLGGVVSRRVPVASLRLLLACCIALAALRIGFSAAGF